MLHATKALLIGVRFLDRVEVVARKSCAESRNLDPQVGKLCTLTRSDTCRVDELVYVDIGLGF